MTRDEELQARIRSLLSWRKGYSEQKMFGSVGFLIHGNMCVGTWKGDLVVRLDKADHEDIQAETHTKPFDVTGRVMKGWALVGPKGIASEASLKSWLDRAVAFARSLPPK